MISIPTAILVFGLGIMLGTIFEERRYDRGIARCAKHGIKLVTSKGLYDLRCECSFDKKP